MTELKPLVAIRTWTRTALITLGVATLAVTAPAAAFATTSSTEPSTPATSDSSDSDATDPAPAPDVDAAVDAAGISLSTAVDDVNPETPKGVTEDGQDSTQPISVNPGRDIPVSLTMRNTGTVAIDRWTITDGDGDVLADVSLPAPSEYTPGVGGTHIVTLAAADIADGYDSMMTVTAYTTAGTATASAPVSISVRDLVAAVDLEVFVNDATPSSPSGLTASGVSSAGDSVHVPVVVGEPWTLSFVITNNGDQPLSSAVFGVLPAGDVWNVSTDFDGAGLAPGASAVVTATAHDLVPSLTVGDQTSVTFTAKGVYGDGADDADFAFDEDTVWVEGIAAAGTPGSGTHLATTGGDFSLLAGTTSMALLLGAAGMVLLARRRQAQR